MNQARSWPEHDPMSRLEIIAQLRAHLIDVMPDAVTMWQTRSAIHPSWLSRRQQAGKDHPEFRGHLAIDSDQAYVTLSERFAPLGYTPLLRRDGDYDVIEALHRVFRPAREGRPQAMRWLPNVVLLLLTVVTTTLIGAIMEQSQALVKDPTLFLQRPALILTGLPASLTIMSILGIHELGHYFVARRHGLDTTLPYFIPVPFGLGTFGAIIRIRGPWQNRKALFDVGVAGPVAGLIVALPLFFLGLMLSPHQPPIPEGVPLGSPLLLRWMEDIVYTLRGIPENHEIYVNAMTFAAWYGLVVTGYNLLPVGQLDGGHVATALLGRWARVLGIVVLVTMVVLGSLLWRGWYFWAAMIFLLGRRHPDPHNTVAPLGRTRTIVGLLVFVLLALLFAPAPIPV